MTGHFFDVAVIAEGMNGLIAAYELSKTDVSVVLIDRYKPSLSMDGYVFNPYPQHLFSDAELPDLFRQLHGVFETYAHGIKSLPQYGRRKPHIVRRRAAVVPGKQKTDDCTEND